MKPPRPLPPNTKHHPEPRSPALASTPSRSLPLFLLAPADAGCIVGGAFGWATTVIMLLCCILQRKQLSFFRVFKCFCQSSSRPNRTTQKDSSHPLTNTQRRPKQEGRGVNCGTGVDAKPGGGNIGGEVVDVDVVMPKAPRTRIVCTR